jgi:hypothetical protein
MHREVFMRATNNKHLHRAPELLDLADVVDEGLQ